MRLSFKQHEMVNDPRFKAKMKAKPRIDREHDVPYVAGYSKDGKTIYIDRHLELTDDGVDIEPFLIIHEHTEKSLIDVFGLHYQEAHKIAEHMENEAVKKSGKLTVHEYESHYNKYIKEISYEKIERPPPDLDLTPYKGEKDVLLLRKLMKK